MKICLNCGDKLLDMAKKCPTCGTKDGAKGMHFPIVDKNDEEKIQQIIASVPHPKQGLTKQTSNTPIAHDDNVARCPKCGSTSLSANKKGFGIGKAVVGATLAGGIGLVAGNIHANKVKITCLNCGYQFAPGKK